MKPVVSLYRTNWVAKSKNIEFLTIFKTGLYFKLKNKTRVLSVALTNMSSLFRLYWSVVGERVDSEPALLGERWEPTSISEEA